MIAETTFISPSNSLPAVGEHKSGLNTVPRHTRPKILVLDDDPVFRSILVSLAGDFGLEVEAYESLQELDPFLRMNSFSGAILDYHLLESSIVQHIGGIESFFRAMPTLLVSADESAKSAVARSGASPFRAFISKLRGGRVILDAMRRLILRAGSFTGSSVATEDQVRTHS